jgi:hypothetical protein
MNWSEEPTTDPTTPIRETSTKWSAGAKPGRLVEPMLYAGNDLEGARDVFANAISIARALS